ncbi:hypothetical protein MVI01_64310 [Myxococcus virescens]|uniref:Uncharacterized protein n=1 Tax=Myxococcus virescens TaxID=83456 RepID=A0A511HM39_9BACT|nr:hypothetical protein MVI01_64310 [Myxococcus virescens]
MSCLRLRATTCHVCGAVRLGTSLTEAGQLAPHGATAAGAAVQAAYPGPWPTCRHGHPWRAGCRSQPVPPTCCMRPPCVLVPPPLLSTVPVSTEES